MFIRRLWAWKARRPLAFELSVSILMGILIETIILCFQPPLLIVRRVGDDAADQMIRLLEQTTNAIPKSPAFVFIDIDDATWKAWGSRLVTPRAYLAPLVERVARSAPLAILLDVDLAFPDGTDGKPLKDFLRDYDSKWPPLLLVRSFVADPEGGLPQPRLTDYDEAIGPKTVNGEKIPAKGNVIFTSPLFERDGDGKVRRWKLFAEACSGTTPFVVPSMHLAAAMIARQALYDDPARDAEPPLTRMTKDLAAFTPPNCKSLEGRVDGELDRWPAAPPIEIERDDVTKRVIYRVAWKPGMVGLGPVVEAPTIDGHSAGQRPLVSVRPASLVVPGDPKAPLPGLAGRIVVIGGSFASGGDRYDTPLGVMPGSLMIINAIEALTQNGTPHEYSKVGRTTISLGVIIVASLLTAFLRPVVAAGLLTLTILGVMFVSLNRFQAGAVLDLSVPAVGAFFHDLVESIASMVRDFWKEGWRWFLKPRRNESDAEARPQEIVKGSGHQ